MTNFILRDHRTGITEKRSLQTHCPIMLRSHVEENYYTADICRCDVVPMKMRIKGGRCSSRSCIVREYLAEIHEEATVRYEMLPVI